MTAFLRRIAYWLGKMNVGGPERSYVKFSPYGVSVDVRRFLETERGKKLVRDACADRPSYLADFGPNVPVEDLGGQPCYYENGEPVYWEKEP